MANERKELLEELFKLYPKQEGFFVTSDNQAFIQKSDANNHSKTLEDKSVDWCGRTPSAKAPAGSEQVAETTKVESESEDEDEEEDDKTDAAETTKVEGDSKSEDAKTE